MIRKTSFLLLPFLLMALTGRAQKVKYKDLFIYLSAKEYAKAEPHLKRYLKVTDDNPNAFLFMGIIYHEKANKNDVLKEQDLLIPNIDSALIFYGKAYQTITEKEIKRNDEWYDMYRRRDLRTAEFGIKLSDVQLDLDKRISGLKDKKERVKLLKEHFVASETAYQKANVLFKTIQDSYKDQKELYLRADDKSVAQLKHLADVFDSCTVAFNHYKLTSQLLGKTGYNQIIDLQEIRDFKKDGINLSDFYKDDLRLWDYKQWAVSCMDVIDKDILPIREQLVTCDIDINKLKEKLAKDSVSVIPDVEAILRRPQLNHLKKYDANAMPISVFRMKAAELEYASDLMMAKKLKDSLSVNIRLMSTKAELKAITKLDSVSDVLMSHDLEPDILNYNQFIVNAYGTTDVFKSMIKTTKDYAAREKARKIKELYHWNKALHWVVNQTDSIPLFADATTKTNKYKELVVVPEDYTLGIKYQDSLAIGYFFSITPTRVPDIKVTFPMPATGFNKRNLPIIKALSTKDDAGQVFFALIYSESKVKEKYVVIIAKIYHSDGLAWSKVYNLDMIPTAMTYATDGAELSVKISSPTGGNKIVVIDKVGKQLQ